MACAWLAASFDEPPRLPRALRDAVDAAAWRRVSELARTGIASPLTTSAGRLFDAIAALCGVRPEVNYEGQAAVELEALADPAERGAYPLPIGEERGEPLVMDARVTVQAVVADLEDGLAAATVAARFHNGLAAATAGACEAAARSRGVETVALSGGVFQNRRLIDATGALLRDAGMRVLTPRRLPPNDGGIAYGQLAVAAARLSAPARSQAAPPAGPLAPPAGPGEDGRARA
jgi:hydrogenase maturation protein HypF